MCFGLVWERRHALRDVARKRALKGSLVKMTSSTATISPDFPRQAAFEAVSGEREVPAFSEEPGRGK